MKKQLIAATLAATCVLSAGALAACDSGKTGESYAPVHNAGYVGYATVTVKGGKIKKATLEEVCFPTYVTAGESVAEGDKVVDGTKTYYKTVKFAEVTLTYDADQNSYMVGTTKWIDWLQTEANAESYVKAVYANKCYVVLGGQNDATVMTKAALNKRENGYGANPSHFFDWPGNAQATVDYVVKYGFDKMTSLVVAPADENGKKYWTDGTVVTGATWTDMYTTKANSTNYMELLKKAYDKVA